MDIIRQIEVAAEIRVRNAKLEMRGRASKIARDTAGECNDPRVEAALLSAAVEIEGLEP